MNISNLLLSDIGKIIEFYRFNNSNHKMSRYFKKYFIYSWEEKKICSVATYNQIANGDIVDNLDYYEELADNLSLEFKLFSENDTEYTNTLNQVATVLETHNIDEITRLINYYKTQLIERKKYIGYQEFYYCMIFTNHLLACLPFSMETDHLLMVEASATCASNPNYQITLIYYLYVYYTDYCKDINEFLKLFDILINLEKKEQDYNKIKDSIYYKYLKTIYYIEIEESYEKASIFAKEWLNQEESIYGKFLALKAYDYSLNGDALTSLSLLNKAEELIINNPAYFTAVGLSNIYDQKTINLLKTNNIMEAINYLEKSITENNIISQINITQMFLDLVYKDEKANIKYKDALKSIETSNKDERLILLIRCFNLVYIDKDYTTAQDLIIEQLFDNFITRQETCLLSDIFRGVLHYCTKFTGDSLCLLDYHTKEEQILIR